MKKLFFTSAILLGGVTLATAQDAKKAKAVAPNKTEQTTPAATPAPTPVNTSKAKSGFTKSNTAKARPAAAMSLFEANAQKNQN